MNKEINCYVQEEEFIANLYLRYLELKGQYQVQCAGDQAMKKLGKDLAGCYGEDFYYESWYNQKYAKIDPRDEEDIYHLILTVLMEYDARYQGASLEYCWHEPNLLMVYGKKVWSEDKRTGMGCPFQNVRGVLLNRQEYKKYLDYHLTMKDRRLFIEGDLSLACENKDAFVNCVPVHMYTEEGWRTVSYFTDKDSLDERFTMIPFEDSILGVAMEREILDLLDPNNPLHKYADFVDMMLVISDSFSDSPILSGIGECLLKWHQCEIGRASCRERV